MLQIESGSSDPCFNLALEDYLLHERGEDFMVLTINSPCIIIGKHQVPHMEVNIEFVEGKGIPVIRRISGGGTVYHDTGNLNFAFIRRSEQGKQVDFRYYTKPVIDFLASAGVSAVFEGRNDLTVDGYKVSGNAEHVYKERVLHHGTLLFDASLENMRGSIKPETNSYTTKGVASRRSKVANLKDRLPQFSSISDFKKSMSLYFKNINRDLTDCELGADEHMKIRRIAEEKYRTWEWNWAYGPAYTFSAAFTYRNTLCQCRLQVKDGIIWECDIDGNQELGIAAKKLIGCRHMHEDLRNVFLSQGLDFNDADIYSFF